MSAAPSEDGGSKHTLRLWPLGRNHMMPTGKCSTKQGCQSVEKSREETMGYQSMVGQEPQDLMLIPPFVARLLSLGFFFKQISSSFFQLWEPTIVTPKNSDTDFLEASRRLHLTT